MLLVVIWKGGGVLDCVSSQHCCHWSPSGWVPRYPQTSFSPSRATVISHSLPLPRRVVWARGADMPAGTEQALLLHSTMRISFACCSSSIVHTLTYAIQQSSSIDNVSCVHDEFTREVPELVVCTAWVCGSLLRSGRWLWRFYDGDLGWYPFIAADVADSEIGVATVAFSGVGSWALGLTGLE